VFIYLSVSSVVDWSSVYVITSLLFMSTLISTFSQSTYEYSCTLAHQLMLIMFSQLETLCPIILVHILSVGIPRFAMVNSQ